MKPKSHIRPIPRSRENKKNEAFGLLFQHNPLPMWIYDLETLRFLDVNEAAVGFYGYSRAEFLKMKISDIRPQEDVSRLKKNVKAKRPRLQHSGEWRHCKKDGSIIHVEITSYKLPHKDHKAALVMAKDITRARQAVDAARVAEISYRSLFNSVAEAIYIQDRKGRFLDVNDGAAKMYGYPREFLIGKTPAVISAPGRNDLKKVRRAIKLAFEGQPQEFEFWGLRSNGEAFPKNVRLYKGIYLGQDVVIALAQDITERKQAEESRRNVEAKYRALVENVGAIFYVDAVDDPSSTIYISPQVETLLGYKPEEWTTHSNFWQKVIHPDDYAAWHAESLRTNQTGESFKMEYRLIARDGRVIWIDDEAVLIRDNAGQPLYWQGVHFDITERKRAEETLAASEAELNAILASMPDVVLVFDKDGRYLKIAPTNPNLLHLPAERMLGKYMHEVFSRQKADELAGHIREALEKKQTIQFEYALLIGDHITWFAGTTSPLTADSVVWVGRDITERKLTEDALQQRLAELSVIYDASQRIQQILTPETLADELIRLLKKIVNYDHGAILLLDESSGKLAPFAIGDQGQWFKSIQEYKEFVILHDLRLGNGIIGWVAQHGQSISLGDVRNDSRYVSISKDVRSELCVPLRVGDHIIGVLNIENAIINAYTESDQRLLETVAAQIAITIQNARLYENAVRRIAELETLRESGLVLSKSLDSREISEKVISVLSSRLNWHHAAVRIRRGNSDEIELLAFSQTDSLGRKEKIDTGRLMTGKAITKVGQGMSGWVIKHGRTINSGNLPADPRYYATFPNMNSGLYVPIWAGGQTLGCISVESEQPAAFSEADERLLTTLASQAASALENTRLFDETRRRASEFEALFQTAADISSQTDLKTLLNTIIERARVLSGTNGSGLYLFDSERGDLELVAINDPDIRPGTRLALGEGLSGRVAQNKEPLMVNDYQTWENSSPHYAGIPITSVLGIPMLYSAELIGVLNVHNRADSNQAGPAHKFTEQDINLLSLFANAAAGAVYTTRLLDQTRRRVAELSALAQTSAALRTASTRIEMTSIILDQLMDTLKADGAALIASVPGRDDLLIEDARGTDAPYAGMWIPPGQGLSRGVIETGEPYINPDVRADARLFRPDINNAVRGIILAPLKYQNITIGALSLFREEKDGVLPPPFSENDLRLLNSIADMAANALQRQSLHEQTARYTEQLVIINNFGHNLSETLDLPHIYEKLSRAALDLLPDTATIFVSLFESNERSIQAVYGLHAGTVIGAADLPAMPFDGSGYGHQSRVIVGGESLIVPDLSVSLKEKKAIRIKFGNEEQVTQSALYVPMKAEGRVIGVVCMQSNDKNRYTSADAELLELVANTAAAAIQNARLFAQLKRRVDQLSVLHSVDTVISSTTDLRVSLQAVLENITRQLKVDAADVLLLNPATLVLQYAAGLGFFTSDITRASLPLGKGPAGKSALERRIVHIPNLADKDIEFAHDNFAADEKFAAYVAVPLMAKGEIKGVLEIFKRSSLALDDDWMSFLEMLAGQAALAIDNAQLFAGLEKANVELSMAYDATIRGWSQALELRDQETQGHSVRVLDLTLRLAAEMGIPSKDLQDIRRGVLLHDIGKMGVPDSILHKPGALTEEEWEIMHKHPTYAYDMLAPIVYLRNSLDIPYCHHEKWDGSGYPRGLSGETIPLPARIFAIVDVFDALTSNRPYRKAWSKEKTLDYIREQSGVHFDPRLAEIFLKFIQK